MAKGKSQVRRSKKCVTVTGKNGELQDAFCSSSMARIHQFVRRAKASGTIKKGAKLKLCRGTRTKTSGGVTMYGWRGCKVYKPGRVGAKAGRRD